MRRNQLNPKTVANAKPGLRPYTKPDGGGLFLSVQPTGKRSWIWFYRDAAKTQHKVRLGTVTDGTGSGTKPEIGQAFTLGEVRELVLRLKREYVEKGIFVPVAGRATNNQTGAPVSSLYPAVAKRYIERELRGNTKSWRRAASMLGWAYDDEESEGRLIADSLATIWHARHVASITKKEVIALFDDVQDKGVPGISTNGKESVAREVLFHARLSAFFAWAVEKDYLDKSPVPENRQKEKVKARQRWLRDEEVRLVWTATEALDAPARGIIRLLLITGQRREEVSGLRWSEIADNTWTIPAERCKNGREHVVHLTPLALEIIGKRPDIGDGFVFTLDGVTKRSGHSNVKKALDKEIDIAAWRVHDLRRTVASHMARPPLNIAPYIIENVLNHKSGTASSGLIPVYQVGGREEENAAALKAWSDRLVQILAESKAAKLAA
ncbi:MAG: tyrosine-type recombinase/integrase [Methyloceanibacter sp.]